MKTLFIAFAVCFFASFAEARPEWGIVSGSHANSNQACLQCHGNKPATPPSDGSPRAPLWKNQYSMNWEMYELPVSETPPLLEIPAERLVSRGKTFYDFTKKKMAEFYQDRCLNIFASGNNFSCKFISSYGKTHLIRYELGNLTRPQSCCLISAEPFWAPRPDVLRNMSLQQKSGTGRETVNWWILDTPLPGPFGYGTTDRTKEPVAFWFPVINGWVQQNFSDYSDKAPAPISFALPAMCRNAEVCEE